MELSDVLRLLLNIRDREPYIVRLDADAMQFVLFFPAIPVQHRGCIRAWSSADGSFESDWSYFAATKRPETLNERFHADAAVRRHYAMYPETTGLRLDRDYAALRELREAQSH